jgi:hypothetical protein
MGELLGLAKGRATSDDHLTAIIQAQEINGLIGGPVVTPWNVWSLPDDWLDTFDALQHQLPQMRAGQAKVDAKLAELKKDGPKRT